MDVIVPQLYLQMGLSHRDPRRRLWKSRSGLCVQGDKRYGAPFMRARAILLYLSTQQVEWGEDATIEGSIQDIADWLGVSWSLENLEKHFLSVVNARFDCVDRCVCAPYPCRHEQQIASNVHYCEDTRRFRVRMSYEYTSSTMVGMRCSGEPIMALIRKRQLAALDLYIWYRWRLHCVNTGTVDAMGPDGPFAMFRGPRAEFRRRQELKSLHRKVVAVWPDCPFHVVVDGRAMRIEHDTARPQVVYVPSCSKQSTSQGEPVVSPTKARTTSPVSQISSSPEPRAESQSESRQGRSPTSSRKRRQPARKSSRVAKRRGAQTRKRTPLAQRDPRFQLPKATRAPRGFDLQPRGLPRLRDLPDMPTLRELPDIKQVLPSKATPRSRAGPGSLKRATSSQTSVARRLSELLATARKTLDS